MVAAKQPLEVYSSKDSKEEDFNEGSVFVTIDLVDFAAEAGFEDQDIEYFLDLPAGAIARTCRREE